MDPIPESYVDLMPCDETLLVELGRVSWASARLHAGVRDAINRLDGASSDKPFRTTLGSAVSDLRKKAVACARQDIVDWVDDYGMPAVKQHRNKVAHAVTYTAPDGTQAIQTDDHSPPGRFLNPELREVSRVLIEAHTRLPAT